MIQGGDFTKFVLFPGLSDPRTEREVRASMDVGLQTSLLRTNTRSPVC